MIWLNLDTATRGWPEFVGSDPSARGTWLAIALYCASVENGGIITDCAQWGDRQWQQTCGVMRGEIDAASKLLNWCGNSLHVFGYPAEQEEAFRASREGGRKGGLQKARNRAARLAGLVAPLEAGVVAPLLRKGKESKEKEGKVTQSVSAGDASQPASAAVEPLSLTSEPPTKPAKAKRAPKQPPQTDAEWLASLAASPAYAGLDVAREHAKASEWCRVRQQTLSRQRFINWLNRADKPLTTLAHANDQSRRRFANGNDYSTTGL